MGKSLSITVVASAGFLAAAFLLSACSGGSTTREPTAPASPARPGPPAVTPLSSRPLAPADTPTVGPPVEPPVPDPLVLSTGSVNGQVGAAVAGAVDVPSAAYGLSFTSGSDGWLLGPGPGDGRWASVATAWHTTDAGVTWTPVTVGLPGFTFFGIQFIDPLHGWLTAETDLSCMEADSLASARGDALEDWALHGRRALVGGAPQSTRQQPGSSQCQAAVLATSDGGLSWRTTVFPAADIGGPWFVDDLDGWVTSDLCNPPCHGFASRVVRTTDGGASWSVIESIRDDIRLSWVAGRVQRIDAATAVVGPWVTFDGGRRFVDFGGPCDPAAAPQASPAEGVVWVLCNGPGAASGSTVKALFMSRDQGTTWEQLGQYRLFGPNPGTPGVQTLPAQTMSYFRFESASTGWMAVGGFGSQLLVTRDSGRTWTPQALAVAGQPTLFLSELLVDWLAPGRLRVLGGGHLWGTDDDGATWRQLPVPPP